MISDPGRIKEGEYMPKTILVVDDSVVVRQVVSLTLRNAGFSTIDAINGVDALKKLQSNQVELIVTDLNMPEMDGITFIRKVRAASDDCRHLPIVMLTTVSQEDKKQEGRAAGATGWVYKPFKAGQLLEAVRRCI
jgi:two-component system chemotaxis response regulator CheY